VVVEVNRPSLDHLDRLDDLDHIAVTGT
jgi:hypothetical protein